MRAKIIIISLILFLTYTSYTYSASLPNYGGSLRIGLKDEPLVLDPAFASPSTGQILFNIFDGLVQRDRSNRIVPALADRWEVSEDRLVWTFVLRKGVKFHNGRELEASDIKYSFERTLSPQIGSSYSWRLLMIKSAKAFLKGEEMKVKGIEILDRYRVKITLDSPYAFFLDNLATPAGYIIPQEEVKRLAYHPVGTGPFKFAKWRRGEEITLIANEDHYEGRAYLDEIRFEIEPDLADSLLEFELGNLDLMDIPPSEYQRIVDDLGNRAKLWHRPLSLLVYLGINCQSYPLHELDVRKALGYAIDIRSIVEILLTNRAIPATNIWLPDTKHPLAFNPIEGRELLKAAGFEEGISRPLKLWIPKGLETAGMVAERLSVNLADIGVEVEVITSQDISTLSPRDSEEYDLILSVSEIDSLDSLFYPSFHSDCKDHKGNYYFCARSTLDDLISNARQTADPKEREELYKGVSSAVREGVYWIPLYYPERDIIAQSYIKELRANYWGYLELKNVWLKK